MTTAISVTNFQTALGNVYDYISAGDFTNAWKYYGMAEAQHSGLLQTITDQNQTTTRRQSLDALAKAIERAEKAANAGTDTERRLIRTQTRHSP